MIRGVFENSNFKKNKPNKYMHHVTSCYMQRIKNGICMPKKLRPKCWGLNVTSYLWSWSFLPSILHISHFFLSSKYIFQDHAWWRHQMETFLGAFPSNMQGTRSFDIFFDLRLNKRCCKQSKRWRFDTQLHSLWRNSNDNTIFCKSNCIGSLLLCICQQKMYWFAGPACWYEIIVSCLITLVGVII